MKKIKKQAILLLSALLALILLAGCQKKQPTPPATESAPPTTTQAPAVVRQSEATLSVTGDMLLHQAVIDSGKTATGYDFSSIYRYFTPAVTAADYAVCNLEVTLAGAEQGYSGYPCFNSPDALATDLRNAGFDLALTANNHCYDMGSEGFHRTQQVLTQQGLAHLGTKESADDPNYRIVDCNGIRIGMVCYTYESDTDAATKQVNGISLKDTDRPLLNSMDYGNLDLFYAELSESLYQMRQQNVDVTVAFLHWGDEYHTTQNATQEQIAQKLCDMGVDVIVGNHPHVLQPLALLTSRADESKKTVCLYSTGNCVSNIRTSKTRPAHVEDGVLFTVKFVRYSDGTVATEAVEALPLWVKIQGDSKYPTAFTILPLDGKQEEWKERFKMTDGEFSQAVASFERSGAILNSGLEAVNAYLSENLIQVEAALGVQ